ncbi:Pentatricopeptide repeat-containing protein [Forsythia ovata]|uniref:Pentatricopeptide repeat-containing protein n=1 Tax=Forsythia ovata TaxID=205694 RepID=A0ABD1RME1_9LAMI
MLLRTFKFQALPLKPHLRSHQSLSLVSSIPIDDAPNDTVYHVSTLIKKPGWEKNNQLKLLVSHMNPLVASKIIALHSNDIPLSLKFFKWVCMQSTYCYDIDSRIYLLDLLVSGNLYGTVHKVIVLLIKEYCNSETDILELMGALEDLRKRTGYRINYPCYSTLLTCLANLKMGLMAFLVYKRMVEDGFVPGDIDWRTIINALSKIGYVQAVEMFVSRILKVGFALDVHVYTSLVLVNCRAGDLNEAFRVFDLMSAKDGCGVNSVTYSILVHGLCEVGRLDEACKLKEEMSKKGCPPSTRTYTVLIKATCDVGMINKAFGLFDEMVRRGCKPNVHTYTVLIDGLCRLGNIEEANGMFRKMLKEGLLPGTVTYNALINGYCKEGKVVSAFELLSVMERRNCKPNIRTYNELIEGLCKVGRPYKAMALLRKVINSGLLPTEVTFNIIVDGFSRAGHVNVAFKILHSMNSIGVEPDEFTYTVLIDALCKIGNLEQANAFLGVMVKKGLTPDEVTLTAFIHGYCKIGSARYALVLFEGLIKDWYLTGPHIFNLFLDVLSKEVQIVEENAIFGKMLKYGLVPSIVTYTILVDGLCRAGDTNSSMKMLEFMKQNGCPPNVYTYTVVINGLCHSGKVEEAETLLVEMSQVGVSPNDITYVSLVKSHVKAGRLNSAFEIVSTMFQNGCQPNTEIYFALLVGMVEMTADTGPRFSVADLNTQSSVIGEKGVDCSSNFVFREIDFNHAVQLQDRIRKCGGRTIDVDNFLISGLCRVGRILEADNLIQEMVKHGLTPSSHICSSIIEHFCKDHNFDQCLEWIKRLLDYGCIPSFASYSAVIVGLHNEGEFQNAQWLICNLLRTAGIEDQTSVLPYIEFLLEGDEPCKCFELLSLIEWMDQNERPII